VKIPGDGNNREVVAGPCNGPDSPLQPGFLGISYPFRAARSLRARPQGCAGKAEDGQGVSALLRPPWLRSLLGRLAARATGLGQFLPGCSIRRCWVPAASESGCRPGCDRPAEPVFLLASLLQQPGRIDLMPIGTPPALVGFPQGLVMGATGSRRWLLFHLPLGGDRYRCRAGSNLSIRTSGTRHISRRGLSQWIRFDLPPRDIQAVRWMWRDGSIPPAPPGFCADGPPRIYP